MANTTPHEVIGGCGILLLLAAGSIAIAWGLVSLWQLNYQLLAVVLGIGAVGLIAVSFALVWDN